MFSGLCQVQAVDDYTGEEADEPVWIEPRRFDTDTEPVRLRKPRRDDQDSAQGASDLLNQGHGFLVRTVTRDESAYVQTTCKVCEGPLPLPACEWLCELEYTYGVAPAAHCGCNWCECCQRPV